MMPIEIVNLNSTAVKSWTYDRLMEKSWFSSDYYIHMLRKSSCTTPEWC